MTTPSHGLELGVSIGYLTLQQAATLKGCSTGTLRNRVRAGHLAVNYLDQRTPLVRITDLTALQVRQRDNNPTTGHAQ